MRSYLAHSKTKKFPILNKNSKFISIYLCEDCLSKTKKGKKIMHKITVKDIEINVTGINDDSFVNITDIARIVNSEFPAYVVRNWMRLRATIDFLGIWEKLNNSNFNLTEFDQIRNESGSNAFVMTATKWVKETNAIGIKPSRGKYSEGTFAHHDIALEFASWISAEVKLYIIKEFQRLKIQESEQQDWQGKRLLTKLNYLIHTEAVKEYLVPINLSSERRNFIYASEADLLNVALFGRTAMEWKSENPNKEGNIRDYANTIELAILSNLEFMNSKLISANLKQSDRIEILNKEANREKELFNRNNIKVIKKDETKLLK